MKKWYEGIYRRQLTDMHINDTDGAFLSEFDPERYYECLKKAKIQNPMIYLQSHVGLCNYDTADARTHKALKNGEIKRLIKLCHDGEMKVVGYYSLIFNNVIADLHPEWEIRDREGKTFRDHGQRYGLCCPSSEEYRTLLTRQIDELASEFTSLDGLFYDMPYWEMICCCPSCKKSFFERYGYDLPENAEQGSKAWLDLIRFRQDIMADFVKFVKEYTNNVMPWVTVEFNYAAVIGCDYVGGSTEDINAQSEFTGGDLYGDLYSHSFACKYYRTVSANQPFEYMTCRCDSTLREHTVIKTEQTLTEEVLLTAAHHGASLLIDAIDPIGTLDDRVYERIGKAFERQMPYEAHMSRGDLYADVAVYFDSRTMFDAHSDKTGIYNKTCAVNAVRSMIEEHIPVAVVANRHLDGLEKYKAVIAPCLQSFDNDEPLKLIDYVKNGGVLYLSGASDPRLTREFFGGEAVTVTYPEPHPFHVQLGARVYISPKDEYAEEYCGFNGKYPIPFTYNLPIVKLERGNVKATVTLPFADPDDNRHFAAIHSCPPWQSTEYPAIIETEYGLGKVIWCIAELEYDGREPFKELFKGIIRRNITPKYRISGSRALESVIFEDGDSILVSVCDLQYDSDKTPTPLTLTFEAKKAPVSVKELGTGREAEFFYDGRELTVFLPVDMFGMYEITM